MGQGSSAGTRGAHAATGSVTQACREQGSSRGTSGSSSTSSSQCASASCDVTTCNGQLPQCSCSYRCYKQVSEQDSVVQKMPVLDPTSQHTASMYKTVNLQCNLGSPSDTSSAQCSWTAIKSGHKSRAVEHKPSCVVPGFLHMSGQNPVAWKIELQPTIGKRACVSFIHRPAMCAYSCHFSCVSSVSSAKKRCVPHMISGTCNMIMKLQLLNTRHRAFEQKEWLGLYAVRPVKAILSYIHCLHRSYACYCAGSRRDWAHKDSLLMHDKRVRLSICKEYGIPV